MRLMMCLAAGLVLLAGCSVTPAERSSRELALKSVSDAFIQRVVQEEWTAAFAQTDAGLPGPDELKELMRKAWVQDGVLTGGVISSMAWIGDDTAKVKINWSFQTGTVPSYSSETYAWQWKSGTWKLKGHVLR